MRDTPKIEALRAIAGECSEFSDCIFGSGLSAGEDLGEEEADQVEADPAGSRAAVAWDMGVSP
jgi:hypothetical protein